jgi:hypothetical protein
MSAKKKKSVMVATPMYGGMCTGAYVQGLLQATVQLDVAGYNMVWAHLSNESLITRGRNELVRMFLERDDDYLMFIDADIGFNGSAVLTMLESGYSVACGIYPKKEIDWGQVIDAAEAGKSRPQDYAGAFVMNTTDNDEKLDDLGFCEVRHAGTGFMLIKREVFLKLAPHVPEYRTSSFRNAEGEHRRPLTKEFFATSIDDTGALLSEDYHFCELWRKHGGRVYANPFIKLDHVGTHVFTGDFIKAGSNIK